MGKIDKSNVENIMALTPVQEGMLFHYLKIPKSQEYFEQLILDITGDIGFNVFEATWQFIVESNEMLRTLFRWEKLERPIQIVLKNKKPDITFYDISNVNNGTNEKMIEDIKHRDRDRGFDLTEVPFRVTLCKIKEGNYMMIITNHHIILDGWSTGIILREFFLAYNTLTTGKKIFKSTKKSFKEYIKHIQNQNKVEEKSYWKEYLRDYEPKSYTIKHNIKDAGSIEHYNFEICKDFSNEIKIFAKEHKVTLSDLFYTVWGILLGRYSNCDDVVFGTTVSGRDVKIKGIEDIVGLFINTVPLRVKTNEKDNFLELLKRTNKQVQERREYENTSLLDIREYSGIDNRIKIFDSIIVVENYPLDEKVLSENNGLKVNSYSIQEETNYGLVLGIEVRNKISMNLTCKQYLLDSQSIESYIKHFYVILKAIINNPFKLVKEIDIVSEDEKEKLIYGFNDTDTIYPNSKMLHELFEEQVERTPDNIALVFENKSLTYRELNDKANSLARILRKKGAKPDLMIGIMIERSLEMIIGIIGILKSGGAYIPIDPDYPRDRIEYMLEDSRADILLTRAGLSERLKYSGKVINIEETSLYLEDKENIEKINKSSDLAYIIYTSGSTGKPKGVLIEHKSIVNTLSWRTKYYGFSEADVVLQIPSFSFDSSVEDIFTPLISGGRLVLIPQHERLDLEYLRKTIKDNKVTHFLIVPSLYKSFLEEIHEDLRKMKTITVAGESFTSTLVEEHFKKLSNVRLFNEYGPTENSVCSTVYEFDKDNSDIVIGQAIDNSKCYILNKHNGIQPMGIPGELCVSGVGLARGYLNRQKLTEEKFTENPFIKYKKMYRTGDIARWLPNGNIEFLGRADHQVKIRGYRIELTEIENVLLKHEKIKDSTVWIWEKEDKDKYLCGYIVRDKEFTHKEIREYLAKELPEYMIPTYFMDMDSLPLTPNGKIDRKALPKPHNGVDGQKEYVYPSNSTEDKLVRIWQEVLCVNRKIGITDNFYELGGNSIKAIQIIGRINRAFDVSIKLKDFLKNPNIRQLALEISKAKKVRLIEIEKIGESEFYELSYNQRKLWIISQIERENTAYNMTGKIVLEHEVNRDYVEKALSEIVLRHESLRTGFKIVNNTPVQFIEKESNKNLIEIDFSSYDERTREIKRVEILEKEKKFVFDISKSHLFRVTLVKLDANKYDLIFNMHHIISDGWSIDILKKEFFYYYDGYRNNQKLKLPPVEIQYKDFAAWQNKMINDSGEKEKSHKYWKKILEKELPRISLPYDFSGEDNSKESSGYVVYVRKDTKEKLLALSSDNNLTLFALMFTAFNILLSKLTGQKEIVCGVPSSGRNHISLHKTVGFFINSIILRNEVGPKESFLDLVNKVNINTLEAFEHQDYPLELVLEELKMRYPDISVFFNMLNFSSSENMKIIESFDDYHIEKVQNAKFDIVIYLMEYENGIEITCSYKKGLFKSSTVQYIMNEYIKLIEFFVNNPSSSLHELKKKGKRRII